MREKGITEKNAQADKWSHPKKNNTPNESD